MMRAFSRIVVSVNYLNQNLYKCALGSGQPQIRCISFVNPATESSRPDIQWWIIDHRPQDIAA